MNRIVLRIQHVDGYIELYRIDDWIVLTMMVDFMKNRWMDGLY